MQLNQQIWAENGNFQSIIEISFVFVFKFSNFSLITRNSGNPAFETESESIKCLWVCFSNFIKYSDTTTANKMWSRWEQLQQQLEQLLISSGFTFLSSIGFAEFVALFLVRKRIVDCQLLGWRVARWTWTLWVRIGGLCRDYDWLHKYLLNLIFLFVFD